MAFLPAITVGTANYNGINRPGQYVWTGSPVGLPHTISIVPNSNSKKSYFSFDRKFLTAGPVINGLPTAPFETTVRIVISSTDPLVSPTTLANVLTENAVFLNAANITRILRNEN